MYRGCEAGDTCLYISIRRIRGAKGNIIEIYHAPRPRTQIGERGSPALMLPAVFTCKPRPGHSNSLVCSRDNNNVRTKYDCPRMEINFQFFPLRSTPFDPDVTAFVSPACVCIGYRPSFCCRQRKRKCNGQHPCSHCIEVIVDVSFIDIFLEFSCACMCSVCVDDGRIISLLTGCLCFFARLW